MTKTVWMVYDWSGDQILIESAWSTKKKANDRLDVLQGENPNRVLFVNPSEID